MPAEPARMRSRSSSIHTVVSCAGQVARRTSRGWAKAVLAAPAAQAGLGIGVVPGRCGAHPPRPTTA